MKKASKFLRLKLSDWMKGLLIAVLTAVLTCVYSFIEQGDIDFTKADWKLIIIAGLGAGISYILKNLATNSEGKVLKSEPKV